jgi:hypothetical protein
MLGRGFILLCQGGRKMLGKGARVDDQIGSSLSVFTGADTRTSTVRIPGCY